MSTCPTKPFHHSGTTSPTDVGPSTGGYLHSITLSDFTGNVRFRDGGSGGTIILSFNGTSQVSQLFFKGMRINGQLNITIPTTDAKVTVEMSE